MNTTTSILASFATLKSLNDEKKYKNSYQLLSEFIGYIIQIKKLYCFTAVEMKKQLEIVFGFDIPEAVVKTASKSLPYISKDNNTFNVNVGGIKVNDNLEKAKQTAEKTSADIIDKLVDYIREKNPEKDINVNVLERDFIAFIIDDQQKVSSQYIDLISQFILSHENDMGMQSRLSDIREGSILYIGINYNINETGSLTKPLTLYLGTEVLFSLVGFNGEIYQQLALDFFTQVRNANTNGKKIKLRYFSDVKKEIDEFFSIAESIVDGKIQSFDTTAMKMIVNGCKTLSDVVVRQSDFYHTVQYSYGILEDERNDYYAQENDLYNLESLEYTESQLQKSWKYISHINKLRKGIVFSEPTEAEYLFITNTNSILKASREQTEKIKAEKELENVSDYAVTTDRITNLLWYKLGNGFGRKEYPANVNSVLKARTVLSSSISHNVSQIYEETTSLYRNGEITQEQLAARILRLRKKPLLPEELDSDSIDDIMDFSREWLSRYEEEVKANRETIKTQEEIIKSKEIENHALQSEVKKYRDKEAKKEKRRNLIKRIALLTWNIFWKAAIIAAIVVLAVVLENKCESKIPSFIVGALDLIALIVGIVAVFKVDIAKYFPKNK